MRLGLRLFFAFFVVAGIAAYFVLRVFATEIKPSVREVMEDVLIDSANLLAEQARADLRAMPPGGTLAGTPLAQAVAAYTTRPVDATIWGLRKQRLDIRVYVTDASGRVVLDSGTPTAVGQDYSRWLDVARTLRGEYGARVTRDQPDDTRTSVMYVAAPIQDGERLLGVLTLAKPQATAAPFIARAEAKVLKAGAWMLAASLAVGLAATAWLVHATRRLRHYAERARAGHREPPPRLPGELGDLALAVGEMRERLEGRAEVEQAMRALTHELKSPLAAIAAAAELLQDPLPAAERQRFAAQVATQVERLRGLADRLLELSRLESLRALDAPAPVALAALTDAVLDAHAATLAQRHLQVQWLRREPLTVAGDAERLALALSNLLANALAFAPPGSPLELALWREGAQVHWSLRDHGPGVPDYAWPQLGQRFFSLPAPGRTDRGSGLGLAIVQQVMALHVGRLALTPAAPGLRATLTF
ncbi:MAG: two-component system sensor histidine kinase CreC [Proteobacteria bacterium]|nr:two-component system sensor histidine kinase CreC [Pseudomonadota bacterium]